jgi:hypothetical protein
MADPVSQPNYSFQPLPPMQSLRTENTQNYEFINKMLDADVMLYGPLARFLISMDIQDVPIDTKDIDIKEKRYSSTTKKERKWVRIPNSLRICPRCKDTTEDMNGVWEYCDNEKAHQGEIVKTEWVYWKPKMTPTGFDGVISMIIANSTPAHSTSNLPETMDITRFALGLAANIDETIFINADEWLVEHDGEKILSRPDCLLIEQTITGIAKVIWERSMKGMLINKTTSQISVQERIEGRREEQKKKGVMSWLGLG